GCLYSLDERGLNIIAGVANANVSLFEELLRLEAGELVAEQVAAESEGNNNWGGQWPRHSVHYTHFITRALLLLVSSFSVAVAKSRRIPLRIMLTVQALPNCPVAGIRLPVMPTRVPKKMES